MKKTYEAPVSEQIVMKFESNIMSNVERTTVVKGEDNGWSWNE